MNSLLYNLYLNKTCQEEKEMLMIYIVTMI